jgi:hypothetical protein
MATPSIQWACCHLLLCAGAGPAIWEGRGEDSQKPSYGPFISAKESSSGQRVPGSGGRNNAEICFRVEDGAGRI